MIYRVVSFGMIYSFDVAVYPPSTLLALKVMTPQKIKTKAILLWWMVSLTCLISLLSIVHISEQGRYEIYTIRPKTIERAPWIYLKELKHFWIQTKSEWIVLELWFFSYYFCHFCFHQTPKSIDCQCMRPRQEFSYSYILSCAGLLL